jgi:hypothetical protein
VHRIVEQAVETKPELIDSFRRRRVPVSPRDRDAFHAGMIASGKTTNEADIDEIIYGECHR